MPQFIYQSEPEWGSAEQLILSYPEGKAPEVVRVPWGVKREGLLENLEPVTEAQVERPSFELCYLFRVDEAT